MVGELSWALLAVLPTCSIPVPRGSVCERGMDQKELLSRKVARGEAAFQVLSSHPDPRAHGSHRPASLLSSSCPHLGYLGPSLLLSGSAKPLSC